MAWLTRTLVLSCVFVSACSDDAGVLPWTVEFSDAVDLESVSLVRLEVRRGLCDSGTLLFATEIGRDDVAEMPPRIASDDMVAIVATAVDDACMVVGKVCDQVRWPPASASIRQQILPQVPEPCESCLCGGGEDASLPDAGELSCERFRPPQPLAGVNTAGFEASAWIASDLLTLYVSRSPEEFEQADIFRATRASPGAPFSQGDSVPGVNTGFSDGYPYVFDNERQIIISRGGDLVLGRRASVDQAFTFVGLGIAGGADDASFVMTEDRLEGYFSSTLEGGEGGNDLYQVTRSTADGSWSRPRGLAFVTNADERYPGLSADGLTLVYQVANKLLISERATRSSAFERGQTVFEPPAGKSDQRPALSADGLHLVFSTDRGGGSFDLWLSERTCRRP